MGQYLIDYTHLCAVSDGRAGNVRQAGALAAALAAGGHDSCTLSPRAPWRWLAPRRLPGSAGAFGDDFARLFATPPGIAVGCGRQAALATRLLGGRGAKTVQVLDPRIDPAHWDLVVAPMHDGLSGANVIATLGSLHPVDDAWLARARVQFAAFETLPRPRTALLVGGGSAHVRFDLAAFEALALELDAALARDGGSVLATASRRTPTHVRQALHDRYRGVAGLAWRDESDGPNPYPGLLAWADRIACTPDSVNMVSEACATHAPVFVFEPERVQGRPRHFLDALLAGGRIRALDAAMAPFDVKPLRETARVAAEIKSRL
jgi:mitochondrial fission protein ELM1